MKSVQFLVWLFACLAEPLNSLEASRDFHMHGTSQVSRPLAPLTTEGTDLCTEAFNAQATQNHSNPLRERKGSTVKRSFFFFFFFPSNNFILVYSTIFYIHFSGFDSVTFEQTLNESTKVNILKTEYTQNNRHQDVQNHADRGALVGVITGHLAYLRIYQQIPVLLFFIPM